MGYTFHMLWKRPNTYIRLAIFFILTGKFGNAICLRWQLPPVLLVLYFTCMTVLLILKEA